MKYTVLYTIKCALGAAVAILFSDIIGLSNAVTAGVIVILSIQDTKKDSFLIANKRLIATGISFLLALFVLPTLNYSILSLMIFLLLFIPITYYFKLQDGIVVNTVLITHFFIAKDMSFGFLVEEALIMVIGVGVALVLNLYMPSVEKELADNEERIKELMSKVILDMSISLRDEVKPSEVEQDVASLTDLLKVTKDYAYRYTKNNLFGKEDFHVEYINMRLQQFDVLKRMCSHFNHLSTSYEVTDTIAAYTEKLSRSISIHNKATPLLEELNAMRLMFKELALPKSREEFENRALLFQFLNDIELFLKIKENYHEKAIIKSVFNE